MSISALEGSASKIFFSDALPSPFSSVSVLSVSDSDSSSFSSISSIIFSTRKLARSTNGKI
jgi:hypothetical protein